MKTNWIIDDLPAYGEKVLLCIEYKRGGGSFILMGSRNSTNKDGEHWVTDKQEAITTRSVKCWMPLPEMPKDYNTTNNKTNEL